MKHNQSAARRGVCVLLLAAMLGVQGCSTGDPTVVAATAPAVTTLLPLITDAPSLIPAGTAPAVLVQQASTAERVVSVVFEGFTDESTMERVADEIKAKGAPTTFFFSGLAASEHPDSVRAIASAGSVIGNYGITAEKNMQTNTVEKNLHQFQKTQELLTACGYTPEFFRCNGSTYTEELLQTATLSGLKKAVLPTVYLNHHSFKSLLDAQAFVRKLARGSIISVKLGQELDLAEYPDAGEKLDERPAIDPEPSLSEDKELDTQAQSYENIVAVISLLYQALDSEGFTILSLDELAAADTPMFENPNQLTDEVLATLNESTYTLPVTAQPFGVQQTARVPDSYFNRTVFIGDSLTAALASYVSAQRSANPDFMGTAQFLTATGLGAGNALRTVGTDSRHPVYNDTKMAVEDAVALMGVDTAYIMLGVNDLGSYTTDEFIENLKMLIYMIRARTPGITVVIQSLTPGVSSRTDEPTTRRIFNCNLALAKFCLQFDVPFVDVAYAMRDETGCLPDALCSDVDSMGLHMNKQGCEKWIDYLCTHAPAK